MAPGLVFLALLAALSAGNLAKTLVSVERREGSAFLSETDASADVDVRTLPSLLSAADLQLDAVLQHDDLDQCLREAVATFSLVGVQVVSTGSEKCKLTTAQFCEYVFASVAKLQGHRVTCKQSVHFPLLHKNIAAVVNDPLAGKQYGPDLIDLADAWADSLDAEEVILAIIDTGIMIDHKDLRNVLWADGKGHHGRNCVDSSYNLTDDVGHGTHCAGIAGAQVNNAIGVAGANPKVKIMMLKANAGIFISDAAIMAGLDFAAKNKAKVVSMSFGGTGKTPSLEKAMKRVGKSGVLMVSAAGNDGDDTIEYPCAYGSDQTLCVAATAKSKKLVDYSTYGSQVDIAAPGDGIISTYNDGKYTKMSGTSMSAPLVAGVASILAGLGLSASEIKTTLKANVDKLKDKGMPIGGGFMNAAKAVKAAKSRELLI